MEVPPGRGWLEDPKEPGEELPSNRPQGQRRRGPHRWARHRTRHHSRVGMNHPRRTRRRIDSLVRT